MTQAGHVLLVACAGAAGTVCRYGMATLVQRWGGLSFPWGTLAVNAVGCFLFGLFVALAEERLNLSRETRIVVLMGFMGAFTTFSTFAFDTGNLLIQGRWGVAALNIVAQNVSGILLVLGGLSIGRALSG